VSGGEPSATGGWPAAQDDASSQIDYEAEARRLEEEEQERIRRKDPAYVPKDTAYFEHDDRKAADSDDEVGGMRSQRLLLRPSNQSQVNHRKELVDPNELDMAPLSLQAKEKKEKMEMQRWGHDGYEELLREEERIRERGGTVFPRRRGRGSGYDRSTRGRGSGRFASTRRDDSATHSSSNAPDNARTSIPSEKDFPALGTKDYGVTSMPSAGNYTADTYKHGSTFRRQQNPEHSERGARSDDKNRFNSGIRHPDRSGSEHTQTFEGRKTDSGAIGWEQDHGSKTQNSHGWGKEPAETGWNQGPAESSSQNGPAAEGARGSNSAKSGWNSKSDAWVPDKATSNTSSNWGSPEQGNNSWSSKKTANKTDGWGNGSSPEKISNADGWGSGNAPENLSDKWGTSATTKHDNVDGWSSKNLSENKVTTSGTGNVAPRNTSNADDGWVSGNSAANTANRWDSGSSTKKVDGWGGQAVSGGKSEGWPASNTSNDRVSKNTSTGTTDGWVSADSSKQQQGWGSAGNEQRGSAKQEVSWESGPLSRPAPIGTSPTPPKPQEWPVSASSSNQGNDGWGATSPSSVPKNTSSLVEKQQQDTAGGGKLSCTPVDNASTSGHNPTDDRRTGENRTGDPASNPATEDWGSRPVSGPQAMVQQGLPHVYPQSAPPQPIPAQQFTEPPNASQQPVQYQLQQGGGANPASYFSTQFLDHRPGESPSDPATVGWGSLPASGPQTAGTQQNMPHMYSLPQQGLQYGENQTAPQQNVQYQSQQGGGANAASYYATPFLDNRGGDVPTGVSTSSWDSQGSLNPSMGVQQPFSHQQLQGDQQNSSSANAHYTQQTSGVNQTAYASHGFQDSSTSAQPAPVAYIQSMNPSQLQANPNTASSMQQYSNQQFSSISLASSGQKYTQQETADPRYTRQEANQEQHTNKPKSNQLTDNRLLGQQIQVISMPGQTGGTALHYAIPASQFLTSPNQSSMYRQASTETSTALQLLNTAQQFYEPQLTYTQLAVASSKKSQSEGLHSSSGHYSGSITVPREQAVGYAGTSHQGPVIIMPQAIHIVPGMSRPGGAGSSYMTGTVQNLATLQGQSLLSQLNGMNLLQVGQNLYQSPDGSVYSIGKAMQSGEVVLPRQGDTWLRKEVQERLNQPLVEIPRLAQLREEGGVVVELTAGKGKTGRKRYTEMRAAGK